MFTDKDTVRAVVSLVVAVVVAAILCRLVKMSHLMGKFVVPVVVFLGTFYLLREYWSVDMIGGSSSDSGASEESGNLEEGLSPQFLKYGHTTFGNEEEMYVDDPDATVTVLPPDHPQYSELSVPREQVIEPEAFNAANVDDGYAYIGGNNQPQFGNESSSADSPCAVGGPCSSYLCSETDVKNPLNLVASVGGPWQVQRAAATQQRLVEGRFIPTTPMV